MRLFPYRVGEGSRGRRAIHAVATRVGLVRQCVLCILGLFLQISPGERARAVSADSRSSTQAGHRHGATMYYCIMADQPGKDPSVGIRLKRLLYFKVCRYVVSDRF